MSELEKIESFIEKQSTFNFENDSNLNQPKELEIGIHLF
jgi:hypothetical protein